MTLNKAFAMRLSQILADKKISKYRLEKETGLTHSTFRFIFNEVNKDLKFSTIVKVVESLGMTLAEFFSHELFNLENLEY